MSHCSKNLCFFSNIYNANSTNLIAAFDVSADLTELSQTPVTVVCAGIKSILDIGKTLEVLVSFWKTTRFIIFISLSLSLFTSILSSELGQSRWRMRLFIPRALRSGKRERDKKKYEFFILTALMMVWWRVKRSVRSWILKSILNSQLFPGNARR